jgi:hypothetical protein
MEKFNLKKLNDVAVKEMYQVKNSNTFVALECLDDHDVDSSRAWESIREHTKAAATKSLGYYEVKQHKPWFDEE